MSSGSLVLASSPRLRPWSLSFLALSGALLPTVSTQPPFGLFLSQPRHCLFQSPSPLFLWSCSFPLAASLPVGCLCLPPTPTVPPGPALFLLATPPSHSQLCHFFPHGMEVLGRRTPESQSSRASVPAPLCGRYLLTSPASPALVCNAKKEPANPQFPPTGPKRSQFVTSLFLILLFSPSFPPPFCWALSIGQKCFSLI